jgi:hypothetical protein
MQSHALSVFACRNRSPALYEAAPRSPQWSSDAYQGANRCKEPASLRRETVREVMIGASSHARNAGEPEPDPEVASRRDKAGASPRPLGVLRYL